MGVFKSTFVSNIAVQVVTTTIWFFLRKAIAKTRELEKGGRLATKLIGSSVKGH